METPGSGAKFLHEHNAGLQKSREVEDFANYLRANGESIPNEPEAKLEAYLGALATIGNDGILTGDQDSIERQIEAALPPSLEPSEDTLRDYFRRQREISRADQGGGLAQWAEHLNDEVAEYPDWFKHYVWGSVLKLGQFNKHKQQFDKRSRNTAARYPELNPEALAYTFDAIQKVKIEKDPAAAGDNDEELQRLLRGTNFSKIYTHALHEATSNAPEVREDTRGSWVKFDQTENPDEIRNMTESLHGHNTGWCTAGEGTAAKQLEDNNFYIYYSRDENGEDTVPRVAIRMKAGRFKKAGRVAEIRGIGPDQNLEGVMSDTTYDKLRELPGGKNHLAKIEKMQRLTAIDNRLEADPEANLTYGELHFLRELYENNAGIGYERDPRIDKLLGRAAGFGAPDSERHWRR